MLSYGNTLTFSCLPPLSLSFSLSLVVPFSLSIPHPRRMSLSGFHGDPVAVVLLRRKKRVRERGRGSGERGEARRSSNSAGRGVTPPIRGK